MRVVEKFQFLAVTAVITAMAIPAVASETIKVGFAIAKSGIMEPFDSGATNAALIKIQEINEAGGLLGRQIEPIIIDTKSDRALGARVGAELVQKGADIVIVSCDYDWGAPAALAAQAAGKLSYFLCAGDVKAGIEGVGPFSFNAGIAAQVSGATMAEWANAERGHTKAYVLLDDSIEYNKSTCAGFDLGWDKLEGTTIVGRDTFKNSDSSIAAQITRIKNLGGEIDVIMMCTYPPGGARALRQIRASGIDLPIMSGMAMDGTYWLDAVPDLSNFLLPVLGSIHGNDPDANIEKFNVKYETLYGGRPANSYAYPGYVLVEMWAKAVKNAGTTETVAVTAALEIFNKLPTLFGARSFSDELHIENQSRYLIMEITEGVYTVQGYWTIAEPIEKDLLFRRN